MIVKRLIGALIAAALLLPTAAVVASAATPVEYGVHMVSTDYWYTEGPDATFSAVGEVRNDTDVPVRNVTIKATALAADGKVVATGVKQVWLDILDPGEISSFRIDVGLPGAWATYRIAVEDWDYTSLASNHYFTTKASSSTTDAHTMHISGSITNANVVPTADNIVVATLYGPDGKVVGTGVAALAGTLAAGESAQFSMDAEHANVSSTPTVAVTAESTSDPQTAVTFAATPTELAFGTSVSITGAAKPGGSFAIQRYDQPTSAWVDAGFGAATAGTNGSYAVTVTPTAGSTYRAVSGGVQSVPIPLFVRTAVTMRASTKATTVGKKVTLSGTARPTDAASEIVIQRKVGSTWTKIASGPIAASGGTFTVVWTPRTKGSYVLRAGASGGSALYAGTSTTTTIVVK